MSGKGPERSVTFPEPARGSQTLPFELKKKASHAPLPALRRQIDCVRLHAERVLKEQQLLVFGPLGIKDRPSFSAPVSHMAEFAGH
ncbi:hypothetical protein chiPu_0015129 [Chiloscyllium punctatum]|uniref:Uncharacterized protein n=1 Tax=Chiloscyllium punctatum TaxID=137246 RepID=A0A401T1Y9_CHIPU|nr:hypothetical protein [Chiloscyllium punctatum]